LTIIFSVSFIGYFHFYFLSSHTSLGWSLFINGWLVQRLEQVKGGGDADSDKKDAMHPADCRLTAICAS
jgi:hypothetical protein